MTKRRILQHLAVAVVLGAVVAMIAPLSASATATAVAMVDTQRMSAPTLNSTQNGVYSKGSTLTLVCYQRGESVQGYFSPYVGNGGWDNLWYLVSDGYYVADIDIQTYSDNPVTGQCPAAAPASPAPAPAPAPAPSPSTTPVSPPPAASSGSGVTVMVDTQRMSSASLNSTQVGIYAKGSSLTLVCYVRGESVKGYFSAYVGNGGWDNLWYRVSDGYYVADVDIQTHSNSPVTAACPAASQPNALAPSPGPQPDTTAPQSSDSGASSQRYNRAAAVAWAIAHDGTPSLLQSQKLDYCTEFVSGALLAGGIPIDTNWFAGWTPITTNIFDAADAHDGNGNLLLFGPWESKRWANADYLKNFLTNEKHYATITQVSLTNPHPEASMGDIIVYTLHASAGTVDHAAIVTGVSPNGTLEVTQRNFDYVNAPWNWSSYYNEPILQAYAHPYAYVIHITY